MVAEEEVASAKLSEERKSYYDKWDKFAKEEIEKTAQELEDEKKKADEELGRNKGPKSQAEKEDLDKREALKEAKKKWEDRELSESAKKHAIENLCDVERVLDSVKLHWKPVIVLKGNKNSKLKIPQSLKHKLVKTFVEDCQGCQIDFEVSTITQHLEISKSKNCYIKIKALTSTVQLDLCQDITLEYASEIYKGDQVKIYHAAVSNLKITTADGHDHTHCFEKELEDNQFKKEVQFVTQFMDKGFVTRRVVRDKGNLPSTKEEIDEKTLDVKSLIRDAELKKIGGNEAFKEKNYAQAAVFYTEALDIIDRARMDTDIPTDQDFTHIVLANRAFCWQKLGHHTKAEDDAKRCVDIKPDYCKGLFRLGLALHAQKKFFEAVPILGKASKIEPKNEQIKQALGFAEIQMRKMMQAGS